MIRSIVPLGVAILLAQATVFGDVKPFELVDGDRVVLIGGTLIERDQSFGYLETRLARCYPDRSLTFRNLGWSGDTVEGPSRARFGTTADGFKHLVDHVLALKPTVIVIGYGGVEAFEGSAGLAGFQKGLDTLLATLEPTKARLVFLAPNRQEDLGRPLPDPTQHNADLALYRDVLRAEAKKRRAPFVDLFDALPDGARANPRRALSDNGLHFNAYGYWREAAAIEKALGLASRMTLGGGKHGEGIAFWFEDPTEVEIEDFQETEGGVRFRVLERILPAPPPPGSSESGYSFHLAGLKPGRYRLKVDGKHVTTVTARAKDNVALPMAPGLDQVEALRAAINAKNELYFYRWRPQNETYLFGFRKHEQGKNAREIAEFDPLIAAKEAEIARLRVPVPHVYELTREGEVGR